jgi:predicted DNA-binding protein with PD1-like motif/glutaredoxin
MRVLPIHLPAGTDVRRALEDLARQEQASGFVLSVVGNLKSAAFACPGQDGPTTLSGELEIITLQGTLSPQGVHLHLSFSDGQCQVWGGHLEHGSLILKGADLLVGFLKATPDSAIRASAEPRVAIAAAENCPWSQRALRMLRSLDIPFETVSADGDLPLIWIDGELIGGYEALAEWHGSGRLQQLRRGT